MATITTYRNGVPNWADVATTDVAAAVEFYTQLFGWDAEDQGQEAGHYHMFSIDGASVAGLGPQQEGDGSPPLWITYIAVDDLDATLAKVEGAGGVVSVPRMDIPGAGSMAAIHDPSDGICALWQADQHIGSELVNVPNTVVWNELTTRDAPAAMAFYGEVLGCDFAAMDPDAPDGYQLMMVGERVVGGVLPMEGDDWGDMPSHWMTYFGCTDTDATAARVKELGGAVSVEPFDLPVGRVAVCNDPTGNAFSVIAFAGDPDPVQGGIA